MAVYLAAGVAAFIYLMATPVRAGLAWKTGSPLRVGFTVGPFRFSAHGNVKYAVGTGLVASLTHDRSGKIHELSFAGQAINFTESISRFSSFAGALRYLFSHLTPWRFRAMIHLSLADASHTAMMYGLFSASLRMLRAVRPHIPLTAAVTADFRSGRTQFDLCGILSCRLGHIMAAGLIVLRDYLSGRIHTWTANSRSKAS